MQSKKRVTADTLFNVGSISKCVSAWGGYTLAQLLLEAKTGIAFSKYMREQVLLPLGMKSSNFGWSNTRDAATPYDQQGRPIAPVRFTALILHPASGDGLVMLTNGSNGQQVQRPIFAAWAGSTFRSGETTTGSVSDK